MDSYIYLIENGDLYNIGSTNNIDKVQQLLRPGKLCASLKNKEAVYICKNLHIRYSEVRLPGTDYFRLNKSQLLECQLNHTAQMSQLTVMPLSSLKDIEL